MARTVMASHNPSSSPSSLAWLCSTRRERDADGHNGNYFPAHASSHPFGLFSHAP